jgi:hypothetical protein
MSWIIRRPIEEVIEEIRSSGGYGLQRELAHLDIRTATRLIALRLIENTASQMVALWIQGDMDNQQFWEFGKSCFLPLALEPAEVIQGNLSLSDSVSPGQESFLVQWAAIRSRLVSLKTADAARTDFGSCALIFLAAVMVITQWTESIVLPSRTGVASGRFIMSSSNVAGPFMKAALDKLGWVPFSIDEGAQLQELGGRIAAEMEESLLRARI